MTRKTKTVATFLLKVEIPTGSNVAAMQKYIIDTLTKHSDIPKEDFTLPLLKKETTYG